MIDSSSSRSPSISASQRMLTRSSRGDDRRFHSRSGLGTGGRGRGCGGSRTGRRGDGFFLGHEGGAGLAALLSLGAWLCDAAMIWFVARSLQIFLDPAEALLISTITVLSTAIPSAPGYVGTYELAAVAIAGALGIPSGPALAMAVLAHLLGTVPSAIGGVISLVALGINWRSVSAAAVAARADSAADP